MPDTHDRDERADAPSLTLADLQRLRTLLAAATSLPWTVDMPAFMRGEPSGYIFGPSAEMVADACHACEGVRIRGVGGNLPMKANAQLLVAAVNHFDQLLTLAETALRQQGQVLPCEDGHEWSHDMSDDWTPDPGTPCDCGKTHWLQLPALRQGDGQ